MRRSDFLQRVCEQLGISSLDDAERATKDDWDSIGALSLLAMLERSFGGAALDDSVKHFGSIRELIEVLQAKRLLEE